MRFCIRLRSARSEILVQSSFGLADALNAELVLCAAGYLVCCVFCGCCCCWNVKVSVLCMLAAREGDQDASDDLAVVIGTGRVQGTSSGVND